MITCVFLFNDKYLIETSFLRISALVALVPIRQLLNPELTASWEKGLTYVAEGSITSQEYMDKLEHFVRVRTAQVEQSNYQYALRQFFDAAAANYKSKPTASRRGGKS